MKNNRELFKDIIGYDDIKKTLKRTIDVLNNQEKYKKLGSTIPHGLFIYGPPGTGKTSLSLEIIDNVKMKPYIIRKTKSDGSFIDYLNQIFEEAKNNQPAIILLDDLDKFSENEEKTNSEEFVAVQALIDDTKNKNIFVIATANDKKVLPPSLIRSGRFDIKISVDNPDEKDSLKIIEYYLKGKKLAKDVNIKNISYILSNPSCADLEKICNQAGIYAGYKNKKEIGMDELIRAALEWAYSTNLEDIEEDNEYLINIAYHEAGHALIGELLEPGIVSFITVAENDSNTGGITILHNNDNYFYDIKFMKNKVKTLLGGKAATEIVFNTCDVGSNSDLRRVYSIVRRFVDDYCMLGFDSWLYSFDETSEKVKESKDNKTNKLVLDYYTEVKELLLKNRYTLDVLANILKEKKILFHDEIEEIFKNSNKYDKMTKN